MTDHSLLIDCDTLAAHLDDPGWRVLDCRFSLAVPGAGEAAYAEGHVPGAVFAHLERDLAGPITPQSGRHPLPDPGAFTTRLGAWGMTPAVMASDTDGRPLYGLEFRSVEHAGQTYTALCNQRLTPVTVSLRHQVKPCDSHDLLANQPQTSTISLPPLQPMILLIKK